MPNLLGRNLRQKRTGIIYVMLSSMANSFCAKVVSSVASEAEKHGYNIMVGVTGGDAEKERMYLNLVQNRLADGIIILNCSLSGEEIGMFSQSVCVVEASEYTQNNDVPYVSIDNFAAAYEATEYLIHNGRKRILYMGVENNLISSVLRKKGYLAALKKYGLPVDESLMLNGNYGYRHAMRTVEQYLREGNTFDAVFAISDRMAAGVVAAMQTAGRCVPRDADIIGFDNTDVAYMAHPQLSTVSQPQSQIGVCAFSLLLERLEGKTPQNLILPHRLLLRETTQ